MNQLFAKETLNRYEGLILFLKDEVLPIIDGWVNKLSRQAQWDILQELKHIQKYIDGRLKKYLTEEMEWIEEKKKEMKGDSKNDRTPT